MAIDFPANPGAQSPINTFSPTSTPAANTTNNVTFLWDGTKWTAAGSGGGAAPLWQRDGGTSTLSPVTADDNINQGAGDITTTGDLSAADGTFSGSVNINSNAIQLDSDGTGTFTGNVDVNGAIYVTPAGEISLQSGNFGAAPDSNQVLFLRDLAFLSGNVPFGKLIARVNDNGTINDACSIELKRTSTNFATDGGIQFYTNTANTGNSLKMELNNDGDLQIGGNIPSAPNITLNADGSAGFENGAEFISKTSGKACVYARDKSSGGARLWEGRNSGGAATSWINPDGGATFNGTRVYVGRSIDDGSGTFLQVPTSSIGGGIGVAASDGVTRNCMVFQNNNGVVGSIQMEASTTKYNVSSDYRLKTNIAPITDAASRLLKIKPSRFEFIKLPGIEVDGFIAHELAEVIPEAVSGEKDAVDDEGKPVMQGVDQSKVVPLLTAALQEALTRIEALEAEVQSLKGGNSNDPSLLIQ